MLVEDDKITFRTVTIGDSLVGKTCIINRFMREKYDPDQRNTVGSLFDSFTSEREGHKMAVHIWDTAGQEQYRSLGTVYFRSAAAALIVFDLTSRQSFDNCDEWLKSFRANSGDQPIVFIIGNKMDKKFERVVEKEEAMAYAEKCGCKYFETSAMNGDNVKLVFEKLVDELFKVNVQESIQSLNIARTTNSQSAQQKAGESGEGKNCCIIY